MSEGGAEEEVFPSLGRLWVVPQCHSVQCRAIIPAFSVEEGRVTAARSTLERRLGKSMGRGGRIIPAPPPKLNKVGVLVGGCALLELYRNSDTNKIQKIKKCKTCLLVK